MIQRLKVLRDDEALRFFVPNSAQQAYINAVGKPEGFIIVFAAANGLGKTACTAAIIAAIIWPELAPKAFFPSWVYSNWRYPRDFRIISTPQQIQEGGSIQREIKRWFPSGQYQANKNGKPYISQYLAKDFTLNLMSYDMDTQAFEGSTNGLVVFDEPPPKPIFNACAARMRKGGRMLFPGTPLMDAAWVMDDLVSRADGSYIQLVRGDIEANCRDHSPNGQLSHDDIERMVRNYDPDELAARRDGQFMHLSGVIYKTFSREAHVLKEPPQVPRGGVTFFSATDPAIGKPFAIVFGYIDAAGVLTIYDEYPNFPFVGSRDSGLTVADYAAIYREKERGLPATRIIDRHFAAIRHSPGGLDLKQQFLQVGLDFVDSAKVAESAPEIETGILRVKDYLAYDKNKPLDAINRPRLQISPTCTNTILAMERWARDAKTSKPKDDGYKDHADALRYLVMANPEYEAPRQHTEVRQPKYGVGNT